MGGSPGSKSMMWEVDEYYSCSELFGPKFCGKPNAALGLEVRTNRLAADST